MDSVADKAYAVTGGNSGIGRATAAELVRRGARVAILGRDPETLRAAQRELGSGTLAVQGDVTRPDDLGHFFAAIAQHFDGLDGVFANAGIAAFAPIEAVTAEQIAELLSTNFVGVVHTVQQALPQLHDGASIVLAGSMYATLGVPGSSIYAASKAAVESLARTLSADLVGRRIRVNAVSPGNVATPILGRLGLPPEMLEALKADEIARAPLQRFGAADEVARAVAFLLSPDSSYMLGETLVLDGGRSRL